MADDEIGGERIASLTGPTFGLELILNVEQRKYMENGLSKHAGARIAIHDSYDIPLMGEYGHDLMPNTVTTFSIQEVRLSFLVPKNDPNDVSLCLTGYNNKEAWPLHIEML